VDTYHHLAETESAALKALDDASAVTQLAPTAS
jgi:hypothetical protein